MKRFKLFFRSWIDGQKDMSAPVLNSKSEHAPVASLEGRYSLEKPEQNYASDIQDVLLSSENESDIEWYRRRS
jgi:hypothetical protein